MQHDHTDTIYDLLVYLARRIDESSLHRAIDSILREDLVARDDRRSVVTHR